MSLRPYKLLQWGNLVITARKRSLGHGNMFTGVCLSTGVPGQVGGVPGPGGVWSWEGCLILGGSGLGVPGGDPPQRLLLRAICILLECILVLHYYCSELLTHTSAVLKVTLVQLVTLVVAWSRLWRDKNCTKKILLLYLLLNVIFGIFHANC